MKQKSYYKRYENTVVYFLWDKEYQQYFKGVSVCSPEDTFDLETGIAIAKQKALLKMFSWKAEVTEDRIMLIDSLVEKRDNLISQHKYWLDKSGNAFSKLIELTNK